MNEDNIYFKPVLLACIITILLFLLSKSCTDDFNSPSNIKVVTKTDTIIKRDTIKAVKILKRASVIHDTIVKNSIKVIVKDSMITDTLFKREYLIANQDTTFRDTIFVHDTIRITNRKGFKTGLLVGFTAGVGVSILLKR